MTLFVAKEIARAYEQDSKHEVAFRFYERIAKSYRKDKWNDMLACICAQMAECATKLNQAQAVFESLFEQLAISPPAKIDELYSAFAASQGLLGPKVEIDMDQIQSFLTVGIIFDQPNVHVQGNPSWQLTLSNVSNASIPSPFTITGINVMFSNSTFDTAVSASGEEQTARTSLTVSNGSSDSMNMSLSPGMTAVYQKSFTPSESQDLSILCVAVNLAVNGQEIDLLYKISDRKEQPKRQWLGADLKWKEVYGAHRELR
jgi:hypothetical protein